MGFTRGEDPFKALNIGKDRIKAPSFVFPLAKKVFAKLVSQDIVSVQPLEGPIGKLYYSDVKYDNSTGTIH